MSVAITQLISRCSQCGNTLFRLEDTSGASLKYLLFCNEVTCKVIHYQGDDNLKCDSAMKLSDQGANKRFVIAKVKSIPSASKRVANQTGAVFNYNNYPPNLKDTCYMCGGTTYMGKRKVGSNLQNKYRVWCSGCGHLFYNGNDTRDCVDAFHNSKSGQRITNHVPPPSAPKPKATNDQILKRKCPKCKGKVDLGTNLQGLWVLKCLDCHDVFYRGINRQRAIDIYDTLTNGKVSTNQVITGFQGNNGNTFKNCTVQDPDEDLVLDFGETQHSATLTMSKAYEANKKRDRCIACSKPTVLNYVITPAFKYCVCVEKLPKEKTN